MTETVFYNRRGEIVAPQAGAVIRPRQAVYALLVQAGHVLLIWPNFTNGIPDLPGGGIDAGENEDQALAREWVEETGAAFPAEAQEVTAARYRHVRGFHAEEDAEFWIYEQSFRLYRHNAPVTAGRWVNPEGHQAGWEPLATLTTLPLNRAHWLAVERWLPILGLAVVKNT